jgi:hypothetical protein
MFCLLPVRRYPLCDQIKDLGEVYCDRKCTTVNIDIKANYGIELTLLENYKEVFLINEINVLDDGDSRFYSKFYGVSVTQMDSKTHGAHEHCVYFEQPSENLLGRFEKKTADIYPATSILIRISETEEQGSGRYEMKSEVTQSLVKELKAYYKDLKCTPIIEKLEKIYTFLKQNLGNDEAPDNLNPDTILEESKRRINTVMPGTSIWAVTKYLIPYSQSSRRIHIRVQGYLNLDEDIIFCRFFVNPDPKMKQRKLYSASIPNFNSNNIFQKLDGGDIILEIPTLTDRYSLMFDVVKVNIDQDKKGVEAISFQEAGLSIYPLATSDGFLNFGRVLLPIFSPTLDWKSVEDFSMRNTWELLEIMVSDKERIEMTNRYIFLSVRDEYRQVGLAHEGILRPV